MSAGPTEIAIVGAGPIGLELAVALKREGINYIQFDAKQIGYTMSWWAPQTRFFSSNERIAIAGVPLETPDQTKATREQYLSYLRSIVMQFDLKVNTYEPVVGIKRDAGGDGFVLTTRPRGGDRSWRVRKVVLVTGGTDRPRKLNVPGDDRPHVSYYFRDPHDYFGKQVLIIGGKNSAVEAALRCHHAGAKVSISYRRAELPTKNIKYWLTPEITGFINSGRVKFHGSTVPTRIGPSTVSLARCTSDFEPCGTDTTEVEADFVLALIGYEQDSTLFELAGLQLSDECRAPSFAPQTMETSVPGIYVAGTAVAGTQDKYSVFLENCHVHVDRIVAHLTGRQVEAQPVMEYSRPES
ncbi:MAG TPA: NAD(P)-binding domain-containing protein [Tepidisphaeraceae bacterium]|nr:NAD(P)-binding domain-containing protein [Tepidisphaeraceae bacterium]